MKKRIPVVLMLVLLAVVAAETVIGQKQPKPWKEWSKKRGREDPKRFSLGTSPG